MRGHTETFDEICHSTGWKTEVTFANHEIRSAIGGGTPLLTHRGDNIHPTWKMKRKQQTAPPKE